MRDTAASAAAPGADAETGGAEASWYSPTWYPTEYHSVVRSTSAPTRRLRYAPSVAFLSAISQCRAALLDEPLKLAAHVLACRVLSLEILLQAGHVIDAGTDLREGRRIAPARPQTGQEISGDEAERERDKKA